MLAALADAAATNAASELARIRESIDMVVFDLDDTLVPVLPQLTAATVALKQFMQVKMPRSSAVLDVRLKELMKRYE